MLTQSLRLVVARPATMRVVLPICQLPRSSVSTIHSSTLALSTRAYAQRASPLTPRSQLEDKDYSGVGLDPTHDDAGLRRIDVIMGSLVAIGVIISGWAYFRSSARRAKAKKRFEERNAKNNQIGAGGGKKEGETEMNKKAI